MNAHAAEMAELARRLWGEPTQCTRDELRFGAHGSKAVRPAEATWFDHEANEGGGFLDLYRRVHGERPADASVIATYDYRDENGTLLSQVIRKVPKTFVQRRPDGNGGWAWRTRGVRRVPYRLQELLAAPADEPVFVVEGEKDVETLSDRKLIATCNAGGAGKWTAGLNQHFRGRNVVILPDADEAGEHHAALVARELSGVAASVRVLRLPGLPPKGDVSDWIAAGGTREELMRLATEAPEIGTERPADGPAPAAAPVAAKAEWQEYLQRNDDGTPIANLANVMTGLRYAPELRDCFAYDEMLRAPVLTARLQGGKDDDLPRAVRDGDVSLVQEWLQRNDLRRVGKDVVHQAVDLRAEERAFHPVRDYLNGLRWDGTPRVEKWLHSYLGCEDSPYTRGIGQMFLIAMVARVFKPGCKADYMLILEGPQGVLKSSACAILGDRWFSDSLPDLRAGKDVSQHLNGKWLIEVAEMSALDKAEAAALKAFVTRSEERYRPSYGRKEVIEPRQCVFIGTTNKPTYLRDETGGRRFWPARVSTIDIEALRRDRDQLFAESTSLYQQGLPWWPDRQFESEHIRTQQENRYEVDVWEATIAEWLDLPIADASQTSGCKQRMECTVAEVAECALRLETARLGTAEQRRITAALERIGWERGKRTNHSRPWVRAIR